MNPVEKLLAGSVAASGNAQSLQHKAAGADAVPENVKAARRKNRPRRSLSSSSSGDEPSSSSSATVVLEHSTLLKAAEGCIQGAPSHTRMAADDVAPADGAIGTSRKHKDEANPVTGVTTSVLGGADAGAAFSDVDSGTLTKDNSSSSTTSTSSGSSSGSGSHDTTSRSSNTVGPLSAAMSAIMSALQELRAVVRLPWPQTSSSSSLDTSPTTTTTSSTSTSSSSDPQGQCTAAAAATPLGATDSPVDLQGLNPEQLAAAASWAYLQADSLPAFLKFKTAEFLVDRWQASTSADTGAEDEAKPFDVMGHILGGYLGKMGIHSTSLTARL